MSRPERSGGVDAGEPYPEGAIGMGYLPFELEPASPGTGSSTRDASGAAAPEPHARVTAPPHARLRRVG
jgi:hypothetical protein